MGKERRRGGRMMSLQACQGSREALLLSMGSNSNEEDMEQ